MSGFGRALCGPLRHCVTAVKSPETFTFNLHCTHLNTSTPQHFNTFYYLATMNKSILILTILTLYLLTSCGGERAEEASGTTAFVGATIFDGTGETLIEDGVMLVREG